MVLSKMLAPDGNAVKSFPIEYPAVLALATDFVTSVASAKTAGTPDNMCLKPLTALPGRGDIAVRPALPHAKSIAPAGQRRERYLMVYTPNVSRFGVSHGSPGATVANAETANSRRKILHGVAYRG